MYGTRPRALAAAALTVSIACCGCAGMKQTTFLHPEYQFDYVERVAVVPFENLSDDRGAGARSTRYFVSELLAAEVFEVVEPGEIARALEQFGVVRTAELTHERALELGRELGVQGIILGSVAESATVRSGSSSKTVVTMDVRMIETETGSTVWSTTHSETGGGFWSSMFGTGSRSIGEVTRKCVEQALDSLIQ